jgi:hypothetical protein
MSIITIPNRQARLIIPLAGMDPENFCKNVLGTPELYMDDLVVGKLRNYAVEDNAVAIKLYELSYEQAYRLYQFMWDSMLYEAYHVDRLGEVVRISAALDFQTNKGAYQGYAVGCRQTRVGKEHPLVFFPEKEWLVAWVIGKSPVHGALPW